MSAPAGAALRARERHRGGRIGCLRATVLGANDGIGSTASLIIGIAAAQAARPPILAAGVAGLVAGARPMAAGEDASVSSQRETEPADLGAIAARAGGARPARGAMLVTFCGAPAMACTAAVGWAFGVSIV